MPNENVAPISARRETIASSLRNHLFIQWRIAKCALRVLCTECVCAACTLPRLSVPFVSKSMGATQFDFCNFLCAQLPLKGWKLRSVMFSPVFFSLLRLMRMFAQVQGQGCGCCAAIWKCYLYSQYENIFQHIWHTRKITYYYQSNMNGARGCHSHNGKPYTASSKMSHTDTTRDREREKGGGRKRER